MPGRPPGARRRLALMALAVAGNFLLVFLVVALLVRFWLH